MGGAYPPTVASRGCILAPPGYGVPWGSGPGNTLGRGSYDLQLRGYDENETMRRASSQMTESEDMMRLVRL